MDKGKQDRYVSGIPQEWDAFCRFIETHYGKMYSVALAHTRDPEVAQEITQDVCVRLLLEQKKLTTIANSVGWLVLVARNTAIDWGRRNQRYSRILAMMESWNTYTINADSKPADARHAAINAEEKQHLLAALETIEPADREILLLHFMEGMDKQHIARIMNVHPSTIGRRIEKTLDQLRETMNTSAPNLAGFAAFRNDASTPKATVNLLGMVAALTFAQQQALASAASPLPVLSSAVKAGACAGTTKSGGILKSIFDGGGASSGSWISLATVAVLIIGGAVAWKFKPTESRERGTQPQIVAMDSSDTRPQRASAMNNGSRRRSPAQARRSVMQGFTSMGTRHEGSLPATPATSNTLCGIVLNVKNEPIAGATVQGFSLSYPHENRTTTTATTDKEGRFTLTDFQKGLNDLTVDAPGYAHATVGEYRIQVPLPGVQKEMRIVLERPVTLSGTVTDENGIPLAGASLAVIKEFDHQKQIYGSMKDSGFFCTETDSGGRFRFTGLKPGFVSVWIQHPDQASIIKEAVPSDSSNVLWQLSKGVAVSGTVHDGETTLAGVLVTCGSAVDSASGQAAFPQMRAFTDSHGAFIFHGLGGIRDDIIYGTVSLNVETSGRLSFPTYIVHHSKKENMNDIAMNTKDPRAQRNGSDKNVHIYPGDYDNNMYQNHIGRKLKHYGTATIHGTVPIPDNMTSEVQMRADLQGTGFDRVPVINGKFTFNQVPAGENSISIDFDYKKTPKVYRPVFTPETLMVREGDIHHVEIKQGTARIVGQIHAPETGSILQDGNVTLYALAEFDVLKDYNPPLAEQKPDAEGKFEFRGLAAGKYRVAFKQSGTMVECSDNEPTACLLTVPATRTIGISLKNLQEIGNISNLGIRISKSYSTLGAQYLYWQSGTPEFDVELEPGNYLLTITSGRTDGYRFPFHVNEDSTSFTFDLTLPEQGIIVQQEALEKELWRYARLDLVERNGGDSLPITVVPARYGDDAMILKGVKAGTYDLIVKAGYDNDFPAYLTYTDAVPLATTVIPNITVKDGEYELVTVPLERSPWVVLRITEGASPVEHKNVQLAVKDSSGGVIPIWMERNICPLGLAPGSYEFMATLRNGEQCSTSFHVHPTDEIKNVILTLE